MTGTESLMEALRQIVDVARPAISAPPADCTNNCGMGPCDCSGKYQVVGWSVDVPALRELLKDADATPQSREVPLWDTLHEVAYALFNEPQMATAERPELPMSAERCLELWRIARAVLYPHHAPIGEADRA